MTRAFFSNLSATTILTLTGLSTTLSSPVLAYDIGGYAVSKHKNCGASNLPGTTAEMHKFFGSSEFPKDARKNFLWVDADVHQDEWQADGDYRPNATTANKFNGVDASAISYIASHGVTSKGVYTALMGTTRYGGCSAKSNSMLLGDTAVRYLILSTCQGLKIGTGDAPTRPGENPSQTWQKSAAGLQCILGYSNNMADQDSYGADFLKIWRAQAETISGAFFKASRAASYANIPVTLCFGASSEEAMSKITEDKTWREDIANTAASAWVYERPRRIVPNTYSAVVAPLRLRVQSRTFAQTALNKLAGSDMSVFHTDGGLIRYQRAPNAQAATKTTEDQSSIAQLTDETAIHIARSFINQYELAQANDVLQATYIIDAVAGDIRGDQKVLRKTVVFHQNIQQLTPLQQIGSVEIAVEASGQISAFTWALRDFTAVAPDRTIAVPNTLIETAKDAALASWRQRFPGAKITWESSQAGYNAGSWNTPKDSADLVIQTWASISEGNFTRRYLHTYQP